MSTRNHFDNQFGVSTVWMPSNGETIFEAIELVRKAEFKTLEIVPEVAPRFCRPVQLMCVGFYPDDMDELFFDKLAKETADFSTVTIHILSVRFARD